jgi:hypothetical protein
MRSPGDAGAATSYPVGFGGTERADPRALLQSVGERNAGIVSTAQAAGYDSGGEVFALAPYGEVGYGENTGARSQGIWRSRGDGDACVVSTAHRACIGS